MANFIHGRTHVIHIPEGIGKALTDPVITATVNARTYTFRFSWNAVGQYFSLTVLNDEQESVRHLLPVFDEFYPVRRFDPSIPDLADAFIGVLTGSSFSGVITRERLGDRCAIVVHTGEFI